jgi:hypothetical protein
MAYMSAADCAIGVHGSNMLLASGLAKSTVELVQQSRLANIFQDILFPHDLSDIRDAFLKYRFIYGNDHLDDVKVSLIANVVTSILAYSDRCSFWFKVGESEAKKFSPSKPLVSETASHFLADRQPTSIPTKIRVKTEGLLHDSLHYLDTFKLDLGK